MLLLGAILLIGLLIGWGLGGALRNLAHLRVRLGFLFPIALVLQVIPVPRGTTGTGQYLPFAALILSYVLLLVAVVANWRLRGFPAILLGLLLNVVPIALNQGMPVSGTAVVEAGAPLEDLPTSPGGKHHLATPEDRLAFLGDVFPVRDPFRTVVSVGDLVLYTGAAWFIAAVMLASPTRPPRKLAEPSARQPQPSTMWGSPP